MKNFTITLLCALLTLSLGFAQNAPIDFEPGGFGDSWTWATFEAPMGATNPTFSVVANPSVDADNGSANVAKMEITYPSTEGWGQAGCETMHGADIGSWTPTATNSIVKMWIYQEGFASPVALKYATPAGAAIFETIVQNSVADAWVEVQFDMSGWIGFADGDPDQFIFFPSYGPRMTGHTVYFDNVTFGATPPPAGDPMVDAPDPTIDESKVLAVYSEYYTMSNVANFNFNAFQGGGTVSEEDIEGMGNNAGKIDGLTFYGAGWDAADVTGYNYVHLNYWSTTSTSFNFYLVDATAMIPGGNPEEPRYSFGLAGTDETIEQGKWVSVFIPLQHFLNYPTPNFTYDLSDIFQYKFDGNGKLWFDNIYFTTEAVTSIDRLDPSVFSVAPNPASDRWTISTPDVRMTSVEVFDISGKKVLTQSVEFTTSATIDASSLETGIYFAKIETAFGISTVKLIKE
ncbi:MAG: T9SS type A sorting domain-containing protein [Bacteroidia bacterium]